MPITPLFTAAELDTHIAAYKGAILSLGSGQAEVTIDTGTTRHSVKRVDLPELRRHLEWLQSERVRLAVGSGPQYLIGRPRR